MRVMSARYGTDWTAPTRCGRIICEAFEKVAVIKGHTDKTDLKFDLTFSPGRHVCGEGDTVGDEGQRCRACDVLPLGRGCSSYTYTTTQTTMRRERERERERKTTPVLPGFTQGFCPHPAVSASIAQ